MTTYRRSDTATAIGFDEIFRKPPVSFRVPEKNQLRPPSQQGVCSRISPVSVIRYARDNGRCATTVGSAKRGTSNNTVVSLLCFFPRLVASNLLL